MRHASGHYKKDQMKPAFKFSKTMTLRTKGKSLKAR